MKRTYLITILAILALLVWLAQKTPVAFLPPDQTDFAGGLFAGLFLGAVISWWAKART